MTNACLSHLRIDQLLNGEITDEHVESCARCTARLDEHRRERDAFAIPLRARRRVPVAAIVAAAAAIALGVWIARPRAAGDATRAKGASFALGFYVRHGDAVRRGGRGEIVVPGDALEFTATSDRDGYLAIVSIDRAGAASMYYPAGETAAPLAPGRDRTLPSSVILDDSLGAERIVGLLCDRAISVETAEQIARASVVPPGCASDELAIEKRRAP
jgi:hypothetical protein